MRTQGAKLIGVVTVGMLVLVFLALPAVGSSPPPQGGTPHPTLPPPSGPPGGAGGLGGEALTGEACTGLQGTVINWGFRNEPDIALRLRDGGWETTQVTSTDGRFQFGPLGQGIAFLSAELSPGQAETLGLMANDVAIRLRCDFDIIANLGLYSSQNRPDPPATLTMGVSQGTLTPGGTVVFYLTLQNGMPHPISHVFVTDHLPEGLTVSDVTTTRGTVEVLNSRMVTVNIGDLPQGVQETIQIETQVDPALVYGTRLRNTASLLYAESAADQAWATLMVGGEGRLGVATPPSPSTSLATEPVAPAPAATVAVPTEETPTALAPTPLADQTPGPTDELLPVTGFGGTVAVPVIGIGLAVVLLGARRLRGRISIE